MVHCFTYEYPIVLPPFFEKTILSSLNSLCAFVKNPTDFICVGLFLYSPLCSISPYFFQHHNILTFAVFQ